LTQQPMLLLQTRDKITTSSLRSQMENCQRTFKNVKADVGALSRLGALFACGRSRHAARCVLCLLSRPFVSLCQLRHLRTPRRAR
jgi:hypothetical protein